MHHNDDIIPQTFRRLSSFHGHFELEPTQQGIINTDYDASSAPHGTHAGNSQSLDLRSSGRGGSVRSVGGADTAGERKRGN